MIGAAAEAPEGRSAAICAWRRGARLPARDGHFLPPRRRATATVERELRAAFEQLRALADGRRKHRCRRPRQRIRDSAGCRASMPAACGNSK